MAPMTDTIVGAIRPDAQPGDTRIVLLDPARPPFCLADAKARA